MAERKKRVILELCSELGQDKIQGQRDQGLIIAIGKQISRDLPTTITINNLLSTYTVLSALIRTN